jgi:hypothetical protein
MGLNPAMFVYRGLHYVTHMTVAEAASCAALNPEHQFCMIFDGLAFAHFRRHLLTVREEGEVQFDEPGWQPMRRHNPDMSLCVSAIPALRYRQIHQKASDTGNFRSNTRAVGYFRARIAAVYRLM